MEKLCARFRSWMTSLVFGLIILSWTALYYISSATSGIWNKQLVDGGAVSPTVLTLLHLLVSLASDVAVMRVSKDGAPEFPPRHGRHTLWDIFAYFIPISIFVTLSKLATYLSYQSVSIALSHTAKASEPIFNALVAAILFKEHYAPAVYISLVPIALGVTLASTTDFTYNHVGFLWAIGSALTKVLQNIYTKKLMLTGKFNFFEIHMYCGAASLLILAPFMIYEMAGAHHNPFAHFPFFSLVMCSVLQYLSSIASYKVLHLVSHLTFTIVNVMKRLVIIISGMIVFGQALGFVNTFGVVLSAVGILVYNVVKDVAPNSGPSALFSMAAWKSWVQRIVKIYNKLSEDRQAPGKLVTNPSELDLTDLSFGKGQHALSSGPTQRSYAWLQGSRTMDTGFTSGSNFHDGHHASRRATVRAVSSVADDDPLEGAPSFSPSNGSVAVPIGAHTAPARQRETLPAGVAEKLDVV